MSSSVTPAVTAQDSGGSPINEKSMSRIRGKDDGLPCFICGGSLMTLGVITVFVLSIIAISGGMTINALAVSLIIVAPLLVCNLSSCSSGIACSMD